MFVKNKDEICFFVSADKQLKRILKHHVVDANSIDSKTNKLIEDFYANWGKEKGGMLFGRYKETENICNQRNQVMQNVDEVKHELENELTDFLNNRR